MKIKEHLPFCKEISTLCIEDRVVVKVLSNLEGEAALGDSAFR